MHVCAVQNGVRRVANEHRNEYCRARVSSLNLYIEHEPAYRLCWQKMRVARL